MNLLAFLTAGGNLPFAISGAFLVLLLTLELAGLLLAGVGVTQLGDVFAGHDVDLGELASDALGYLHWGKVPLLVLLASLSGLFALAGFGLQSLAAAWLHGLLPAWLAALPALAAAIVGTHLLALPISRLMPGDSGEVISDRGLLSLVGVVRMGPVTAQLPGEALLRDLDGREHLVRIVAAGDAVLAVGTEVVITGRAGAFYTAAAVAAALSSTAAAGLHAGASADVVRSTSARSTQ